MLKRIYTVFDRFFLKSITFKIPLKSKILLYNKDSQIFNKTINKKYISKLSIDRREINIFILFLSLFNGSLSFKNYAKTFIKFVDPKIVLTFTDNDIDFYKLKHFFPQKCFISVQNGYRFDSEPFIQRLVKEKNKDVKLEVDYYFTFNEFYSNFIQRYIKFKPIINGSFRNNLNKIKKKKKFKKDIIFISQYSQKSKNITLEEDLKNYLIEKKLLTIIEKYCLKKKIFLIILLKNKEKNTVKYINEINYYNSFLLKNFKLLRKNNSYNFIDEYENILTVFSTLGYEALVRKKKVFFCSNGIINLQKTLYKFSFGWPKKFKKQNFLINDLNEKKINSYLNKYLDMSYQNWSKKNFNHFSKLMKFDYKNKHLSKIIKKHLN